MTKSETKTYHQAIAGQISDVCPKALNSGYRMLSDNAGNQENDVWSNEASVPLFPPAGGKKTVCSYACTTWARRKTSSPNTAVATSRRG